MPRLNKHTKCPKCGGTHIRVVSIYESIDLYFDIVRRRQCHDCGHRWYTGQKREVALHSVEFGPDRLILSATPAK